MKFGGITHIITDLEKSGMLYEKVLGFERGATYEPTGWQAYKMQDGVFFAIGELQGSTNIISYTVSDIDGYWERVKDNVDVVCPLEKTPWGTYRFVIRDPNGQLLAFGQQ